MFPLCNSPYAIMLLFEGSWNLSRPFLSYLDFACRPFPVQLLVRAPYDRVLPHYTALLSTSCWMMGDALMPSFQRISSHRLNIIYSGIGIYSHFECLETCSHQWQVLSPSTFFGNTSMSPDRWILSSVRPQHIYLHLLVCTLVPWFPFSLSVGDLASVNSIH